MSRKDYGYQVLLRYVSDDELWVAEVPDLPGCSTHGITQFEALTNAQDAIFEWIDTAREKGWPIPEPRDNVEYSGKFLLRIPKSLHRRLALLAEQEGVSLNSYVTCLLSMNSSVVPESVGRESRETVTIPADDLSIGLPVQQWSPDSIGFVHSTVSDPDDSCTH